MKKYRWIEDVSKIRKNERNLKIIRYKILNHFSIFLFNLTLSNAEISLF